MDQFSREEILFGKEKVNKLKNSKVLVFGLGGVGSYVVEGLARAGIGNFILVDKDTVDITNINRQLVAYLSTTFTETSETLIKIIVDVILFFASFYIQDKYIFNENRRKKSSS